MSVDLGGVWRGKFSHNVMFVIVAKYAMLADVAFARNLLQLLYM